MSYLIVASRKCYPMIQHKDPKAIISEPKEKLGRGSKKYKCYLNTLLLKLEESSLIQDFKSNVKEFFQPLIWFLQSQ